MNSMLSNRTGMTTSAFCWLSFFRFLLFSISSRCLCHYGNEHQHRRQLLRGIYLAWTALESDLRLRVRGESNACRHGPLGWGHYEIVIAKHFATVTVVHSKHTHIHEGLRFLSYLFLHLLNNLPVFFHLGTRAHGVVNNQAWAASKLGKDVQQRAPPRTHSPASSFPMKSSCVLRSSALAGTPCHGITKLSRKRRWP